MKKTVILTLLLVVGIFALWSGTYEHEAGGLSIWFPDDWKVKYNGDELEADAPDNDAFAYLMVLPDIQSVEEAIDAYVQEIGETVRNFKIIGEGEEANLNGLSFYYIGGEGVMDGVDVESSATIIITPSAYALLMTINEEASRRKYKNQFIKIAESIKAI